MIKLKNLILEKHSKVSFIALDMDGVLTDFSGAFRRFLSDDKKYTEFLNRPKTISDNRLNELGLTKSQWISLALKFRDEILKSDGDIFEKFKEESKTVLRSGLGWKIIHAGGVDFWATMDWQKGGKELVEFVKSTGIPTGILTAGPGPLAGIGKKTWIKNAGLEDLPFKMVQSGRDKQNEAQPGHILIDDNETNVALYQERGGLGIIHRDVDSTINTLKSYIY